MSAIGATAFRALVWGLMAVVAAVLAYEVRIVLRAVGEWADSR